MTFQRKPKKPVKPWREGILDHHKKGRNKADRGEFPAKVIQELIAEADGLCQVCRSAPDTSTHHVWPRGRGGRGVKTNSLRCCWPCHDRIQTNEEELQHWIGIYRQRYGDHFYFDEQDHDEYARRQAAERDAEEAHRQRIEALEPILELVGTMTGRKPKTAEMRLLEYLNDRQISTLLNLLHDMVPTRDTKSYAYGERFED